MRRLDLGWLPVLVLLALASRAPAEDPKAPDEAAPKFLRLTRDAEGELESMDTAVVHYKPGPDSPLPADVTVDLIGAVHVGERSYYDELNRRFEDYDVVLYELVAPEGTRVPKGGGPRSSHPVGMLQDGMKQMLGLEHQLECVDYQKKNLVHADMSPEQFADTMRDRGENFFTMFFRMMGHSMAQQGKSAAQELSLFDLLRALRDPNQSYVLKRLMAEQFENLEGMSDALAGPEGSTILTERNRVALETLRDQLEDGHKRIGVFYGAAHLPDMEERLAKDFGLQREGQSWVQAWNLKPRAKSAEETERPKQKKPLKKKSSKSRAVQV
jgi:hypothetical protein